MKRNLGCLLVGLPLLALFAYLFCPLALGLVWLAVALKPLGDGSVPIPRRLGRATVAVAFATILFLGFLSAVHALVLLGLEALGVPELHPLSGSWGNLLLAFPGLFLGFLGARLVFALAYELRKLILLSPSRIADVRVGLHEIRGTARAVRGAVPFIDARGPEAMFPDPPPDALLHFVREERDGGRAERATVSRFVVEDGTGRLLVDPEGVRPWRGAESPFWERFSKALLTGRIRREELPGGGFRETRSLRDGDPVHLVGWVDRNPEVPDEEGGPERFLLRLSEDARRFGRTRALSGQRWDVANLVPRCREAAAHAFRGESPRDVFLLSDAEEIRIRSHFIRAIRQASVVVILWILLPLWLVKDTIAHAPYRHWKPAEIAVHAPPPERREALDRATRSEQPERRAEAVTAIARSTPDPDAMRRVIDSLGDPDSRVRLAALQELRKLPLRSDPPDLLERLIHQLRAGRPEVVSGILPLLPTLDLPPSRLVPALGSAFSRTTQVGVKVQIAEALATQVDRDSNEAERVSMLVVPALLEIMGSRTSSNHSFRARNVLHRIAQADPRTAGGLLAGALVGGDGKARDSAALALSSLGPAAHEARPALEKAAGENPSSRVRLLALRGLRAVDPSGEAAGRAAIRRLADESVEVRREALEVLVASPPSWIDDASAATLGTMATGPSPVERNLAQGLIRSAGGARAAAPALVEGLRVARDEGMWLAVRPLLQRAGDAALEPLVRATRDDVPATRRYATEALGYMGQGAIPALRALEKDAEPQVRWAAQAALVRVSPGPDPDPPPAPEPAPIPRPAAPVRASPASRPFLPAPVVVTAVPVSNRFIHRGWMPRAPLTQQPQVIPIVTKADWASASRALGIPDESAERIEILQKDLVFFLVTAGVKKTPGQSIHVTEVRRLPDRSGLVFRIFEDENPIGAPRGVTEYPYILIGLSVKDVLPVDSCVGRRYEVWPAVLHTSYRNP